MFRALGNVLIAIRRVDSGGVETALLLVRKIRTGIPLKKQKPRQIAVVDLCRCGRRDDRLGVNGNAQSGAADHPEVIRAVANCQRIRFRYAQPRGNLFQRLDLGLTPEDRTRDIAGKSAVFDNQFVGSVLVKLNIWKRVSRNWTEHF